MTKMLLSKAVEGFLISRAAEGYSQETLKIYRADLQKDYVSPSNERGHISSKATFD